jgi:hypothetical protein
MSEFGDKVLAANKSFVKRQEDQKQQREQENEMIYDLAHEKFGLKKVKELLKGIGSSNKLTYEILRLELEAKGFLQGATTPAVAQSTSVPAPSVSAGDKLMNEHLAKVAANSPPAKPQPQTEPKLSLTRQKMREVARCFPEFDAPNDCTDRQYFESLSAVAFRNFVTLPGMESEEALSKKYKRDPDPSNISKLVRSVRRDRIAQILKS